MNKDVYEYLKILGFTQKEIYYIEENNDNVVYANLGHVKQIILFLQNLGLNIEDIRKLCTSNVFMITETFGRINRLNNIYFEKLGLNVDYIHKLILENPHVYTVNPIEFEKIINYLKGKNYSIERIQKLIIEDSRIIYMSFNDFIEKYKAS